MKYLLYTAGLIILTLGVGFTIQADLGASPYDALLVGLSKSVGLTVGSWEVILALILIFFNAIMKKEKPYFLGGITAIITGIGIDFWLFLLKGLAPSTWYSGFLCFAIGLVLTGLGTAIYLRGKIAPMPLDHTMLIIKELTGKSLFYSRTLLYVVFFILAFIFGGPIGVGTILTVCLGGSVLNGCVLFIDKFFSLKTNVMNS